MKLNKELLKKLNSSHEKGDKNVRSAISQIKTIAKIDQNSYILRQKVKIKDKKFFFQKKKCNFGGKAALLRFFFPKQRK